MKSRMISFFLCILVVALVSWSVSGKVTQPDTAIPPAADLELPSSLLASAHIDANGAVCELPTNAEESEAELETFDRLVKDLDQLLKELELERQAVVCPAYFYQPFCAGCGAAVTQCINEGQLSVGQCADCGEVCRCGAIGFCCF